MSRRLTLCRLRSLRESILALAASRGLTDVRVFGSLARDASDETSDVDLLVHPAPDSSVFDLAGFMAEAADLLGVDVDVVSDRGTGPAMQRIRAEVIPI